MKDINTILTVITVLVSCVTRVTLCEEILEYTWPEDNDKYDCVVGISYNGTPICSGHIISRYLIITAATPIESVYDKHGNFDELYVHTIAGAHDKSLKHKVKDIQYQSERKMFLYNTYNKYPPFSFRQSIHDIAILTLEEHLEVFTIREPGESSNEEDKRRSDDSGSIKYVLRPADRPREYQMRPIINVKQLRREGWFSFAGHGFIDKQHVKGNLNLEVILYDVQSGLKDCDLWIPRSWGYFICIFNVEKFVGITAGAPLYYDLRFIGIGAFCLSAETESVLVFTDLRKYGSMYSAGGIHTAPLEDDPVKHPDDFPVGEYYSYT